MHLKTGDVKNHTSTLGKEVTNIPWWPGLACTFQENYNTSDLFSVHKRFLKTAHLPILVITSVTQHYNKCTSSLDSTASRDNTLLNINIKTKKAFEVNWQSGGERGQQVHVWFMRLEIRQEVKFHNGLPLIIKMVSALRSHWIKKVKEAKQ